MSLGHLWDQGPTVVTLLESASEIWVENRISDGKKKNSLRPCFPFIHRNDRSIETIGLVKHSFLPSFFSSRHAGGIAGSDEPKECLRGRLRYMWTDVDVHLVIGLFPETDSSSSVGNHKLCLHFYFFIFSFSVFGFAVILASGKGEISLRI